MDNNEDLTRIIDERILVFWKETPRFGLPHGNFSPNEFIVKECFNKILQLDKRIGDIEKKINILAQQIRVILKEETEKFKNENDKLKEEIGQLKKQQLILQNKKSYPSPISSNTAVSEDADNVPVYSDPIVEAFNDWAKGSRGSLPAQFKYSDGELRLREKQDILDFGSNKNALWITNRSGSKKYIFPNPDAIDQIGGDIDVIYTISGTRRGKGQNNVFIKKACEVKEDGWIEYKGELVLS